MYVVLLTTKSNEHVWRIMTVEPTYHEAMSLMKTFNGSGLKIMQLARPEARNELMDLFREHKWIDVRRQLVELGIIKNDEDWGFIWSPHWLNLFSEDNERLGHRNPLPPGIAP